MHQERDYPERVIGTDILNPDFCKLAEAYGAYAERVTVTEEFAGAFERARAAGRPALLELITDPELLTPTTTIKALRDRAR
jgi:acetolactate synthase-1/2/3 large subunit